MTEKTIGLFQKLDSICKNGSNVVYKLKIANNSQLK